MADPTPPHAILTLGDGGLFQPTILALERGQGRNRTNFGSDSIRGRTSLVHTVFQLIDNEDMWRYSPCYSTNCTHEGGSVTHPFPSLMAWAAARCQPIKLGAPPPPPPPTLWMWILLSLLCSRQLFGNALRLPLCGSHPKISNNVIWVSLDFWERKQS